MGREVNLIFRLEKLAGSVGEHCGLSGPAQAKLAKLVASRPLGEHELKGFEEKCTFFAV
jgi:class 3 adenylate cyclase